jgi:hypothetical protein
MNKTKRDQSVFAEYFVDGNTRPVLINADSIIEGSLTDIGNNQTLFTYTEGYSEVIYGTPQSIRSAAENELRKAGLR